MIKYITEEPFELGFSLRPQCPTTFNSDPEGDYISDYFNYAKVYSDFLVFGNESVYYKLNRNMTLFEDSDLEIPIGVQVYSEESGYKEFDFFDGMVTNHTFEGLLNFIINNLIPTNEIVNKERDRVNSIKQSKIIGMSNIISADIISNAMHNSSLRLSGKGIVM